MTDRQLREARADLVLTLIIGVGCFVLLVLSVAL